MNTNNLIKVQTLTDNSSGYFFKSYDDKKSFVITSKHSICEFRSTCDLIKSSVKDCCRNCSLEFDTQKIHLLSSNDVSLHIEKIYYDKAKDLVILNVSETANDTLIINEQSISDYYVSFGFNSSDSGITPLVFDVPRVVDTLIYYNLHSNPTPNLIEKEDNFKGISGSVIFTHHEKYPTAKALIIHNENHNDFGAESLDTLNFSEINDFFECNVFDQRLYIPEVKELNELSQQNLEQVYKTIDDFELPRTKLHEQFEEKSNSGRFIQITGLSGTGKSAFLRQIAESKTNNLPFLFIKSDQLTGSNNWLEYLSRARLPSFSIAEWLISLEAVGGVPLVFIDGIDRVSENSKPIIEDLIRTIVNNHALSNWKIVTTLRDTGLEPLKVWIGALLKDINIQTINIELLNDDECTVLAQQIPSIHKLLFSDSKVKEIIRRPFFAKVLTNLNDNNFEPESELELIDAWWERGGFSATGEDRYNRQDLLKNLSELKSQNLSNSVKRRDVSPINSLDSLVVDGIVCVNSKNSTVDFTHDIFYEWTLLYVLQEEESEWLSKIESFGEPPFISRTVELLAQREFVDNQWVSHLANPKFKELRSQWLRSWVMGPIGHPKFMELNNEYTQSLSENNFDLFNKLLIWFQAEKTKACPIFLEQPNNIDVAIQYAWPSDIDLWKKLLIYLFQNFQKIPIEAYPKLLKIFEVWQNLCRYAQTNTISSKILQQSLEWLIELSDDVVERNKWNNFSELTDFRHRLIEIILLAANFDSSYPKKYLEFLISSSRPTILNEDYKYIILFSRKISLSHPRLLADLTLKYLLEELPKERLGRINKTKEQNNSYIKKILEIPENERTEEQKLSIRKWQCRPSPIFDNIQDYDWESLSIGDDSRHFYPGSPLKEPFLSLLNHSEDHGLELIRNLSNHAIQAWKQLCEISEKTPLPTIIEFPWGTQEFWGNKKEYIWKTPVGINNALSSAYMALEKWCFDQLEAGRDFDELIQKIISRHESVAILGILAVLVLEKEIISSSVFSFITNFKILELDKFRFEKDVCNTNFRLIPFQNKPEFKKDIEVIKDIYNKKCHKLRLELLLQNYFIDPQFHELMKDKLSNFNTNLPFNYEHEKADESCINSLKERADFYAGYVDSNNYSYQQVSENQISVSFNHPYYQKQLESQEYNEQINYLEYSKIAYWAEKSLEANAIQNNYTIESVMKFLKGAEDKDLFLDSCDVYDASSTFKSMKQSAFSALAAIVLVFRENSKESDLTWAREINNQVVKLSYSSYEIDTSSALLGAHPNKFLAQSLVNEILHNSENESTLRNLFNLLYSPSHEISLVALQECLKLWEVDQKYSWAAIYFVFSLCHDRLKFKIYNSREYSESAQELDLLFEQVNQYMNSDDEWCDLPAPVYPWVKLSEEEIQREQERKSKIAAIKGREVHFLSRKSTDEWERSNKPWDFQFASKIFQILPIQKLLTNSSQEHFIKFVEQCLSWTIEKQEPSWLREGERIDDKGRMYEWNFDFIGVLAEIVGLLPTTEIESKLLLPILNIKDDDLCWDLLSSFTSAYISTFIYDEKNSPSNAMNILDQCLDRLLKASCFRKDSYRAGEISGFGLPTLVKSLMFVSINRTCVLSSRFANNDWSEIEIILPLVDKYIRAVGWSGTIMRLFLELCKRAIQYYPSDIYADQVLEVISSEKLINWNELIYAKISELIQSFVDRDKNMPIESRQKLLKIIDWLVDHGDRRSAALQSSAFFQNTKST